MKLETVFWDGTYVKVYQAETDLIQPARLIGYLRNMEVVSTHGEPKEGKLVFDDFIRSCWVEL